MAAVASPAAYMLRGWQSLPLALAGAFCTLTAVALPIRETRKKDRQLEAANTRAELAANAASAWEKRRLCSVLKPLAEELVTLTGNFHAAPNDTKRHLKQLVAHIVAPKMGHDVRLTFFKYELAPRRLVFDAVSH